MSVLLLPHMFGKYMCLVSQKRFSPLLNVAFGSLYQDADKQSASHGEERRSSDVQSKLIKAAMEENHSESAGSSVTSWDVDVSRGGSHDIVSRGTFVQYDKEITSDVVCSP